MVAAQRVRSSRTQPEPRGLDAAGSRIVHRSHGRWPMGDAGATDHSAQAGCVLAIVRTGTGVGDR